MVRKFCYRQRGHDFGPFTADEMRTEAADGRVELDAIVWEYGTTTGVYAKDVVGLFSAPNGEKTRNSAKSQPPPLNQVSESQVSEGQVSDACVFEYAEFLFYKELHSLDEECRLGVFTREEAARKQTALLTALRRIGEALGRETSRIPVDDPRAFLRRIEEKYRDPERIRHAAQQASGNGSGASLDSALLGALVGAAAAAFVPWGREHDMPQHDPPRQDSLEHDTVVEEESQPTPPEADSNATAESAKAIEEQEMVEQAGLDGSAGETAHDEEHPIDYDVDEGIFDDDFDEYFDGVSENWD